jgi:hypothetical protein
MNRLGRPGAMIRRTVQSVALVLLLGGCGSEPAPSVDLVAVPTQTAPPLIDLGPLACPAALLEGVLVRHEEAGLAVQGDPNFPPTPVLWPHGWVARDMHDVRELLDAAGRVVGREGDFVSAGGGMNATDTAFVPCGPPEITPAG